MIERSREYHRPTFEIEITGGMGHGIQYGTAVVNKVNIPLITNLAAGEFLEC